MKKNELKALRNEAMIEEAIASAELSGIESIRKTKKKIIIDIDGWVSLEDGEQEIGLGDIGVDVIIEDRRDEHEQRKLLEGFAHVLNCPICKKKTADRACDETSKDMA